MSINISLLSTAANSGRPITQRKGSTVLAQGSATPSTNVTFSELCGANYVKDRNFFFAINHIFPK